MTALPGVIPDRAFQQEGTAPVKVMVAGVTPAVPLVYDATVAVVPAVHDEGVVTDGLVPAPRPVAPDGLSAPG